MSTADRFHSLDAVRATALLSGIALHAAMSFMPGMREINWPISDDSTSLTLSGTFFVIHIFRMCLFYAIAGFFAHLLLHKVGTSSFVKNRLRRIAFPLIAGMLLIGPTLLIPFLWARAQLGNPGLPALQPNPDVQMPMWAHFWFLYLLLQLYLLCLVVRWLVSWMDRRGGMRATLDRMIAWLIEHRLAAAVFAAPTAVILYFTPWWQMWLGIPTPLMGLIPSLPAVIGFGSAFAFGWFLHRQTGLLETLRRDWLGYLLVAATASAGAIWLVGVPAKFYNFALPNTERAVYAVAYNLACWCWMLGLIGAAVRYLSRPSTTWRYLADASFFMYIVHLTIVNTLQAWVMRWPLHWSVKYVFVLAATFALLLLMYHYLVRSTFVGQFLNGRRYPRNASVTSAPSTSPG